PPLARGACAAGMGRGWRPPRPIAAMDRPPRAGGQGPPAPCQPWLAEPVAESPMFGREPVARAAPAPDGPAPDLPRAPSWPGGGRLDVGGPEKRPPSASSSVNGKLGLGAAEMAVLRKEVEELRWRRPAPPVEPAARASASSVATCCSEA
ncbi:unnamed protein product, partial [Prorocentrum cordatum]